MKKLLFILSFVCVIFSSCQSNDELVQDDENFESSESSSISENISDESESDTTTNNLYDLSYDEYFSKERPYVYHHPASQKNYIYNIKEGYLVKYPQGKNITS